MPNQIDEATKETRYQRLMSLQRKISRDKQKELVGKVFPVLVEGFSDETELLLKARTSQQAPDIDGMVYINEGKADVGEFVNVEITASHDYDIVGRIV